VKRFFREGGTVRLQPENPDLEPTYPREVAILGKVVLSLRRFT
jgi:SOS-response transcriptional repressor LexA